LINSAVLIAKHNSNHNSLAVKKIAYSWHRFRSQLFFQALLFFPNALQGRHFGSLSGRFGFLGGGLVGTHSGENSL
jgi:hypothetical protein